MNQYRARIIKQVALKAVSRSLSTKIGENTYIKPLFRRAYVFSAVSGVLLASYLASSNFILNESTDDPRKLKKAVSALTDYEENKKLRSNEESYFVKNGKGVLRYDVCQLASNNPIEDDRSEKFIIVDIDESGQNVKPSNWSFWGVYDGHSGWYTSAKLRDELIDYVAHELKRAYEPSKSTANTVVAADSETVDNAIKLGFLKLDNDIINTNIQKALSLPKTKNNAAQYLFPAYSGACGLLAFYDSYSRLLKVAVTGDSRALYGSFDNGKWTVKSLSTDQTGSNKDEAQRIRNEHPGESYAVTRGRVLGRLEPSRAFGDGIFKWGLATQEKLMNTFFGRSPPSQLKTPPYVTAEPVITSTKIDPSKNSFMVIGTDGLYEMLTNEEIAGLVIKWAEHNKVFHKPFSFSSLVDFSGTSYPKVEDITKNKAALKPPYRENLKSDKKVVLEDDNVATHVVRNSLTLGTGDKDYGKMLLNIPSPLSRKFRDDLTVVVVFFGDDGQTGSMELAVNSEATHGGLSLKPKL